MAQWFLTDFRSAVESDCSWADSFSTITLHTEPQRDWRTSTGTLKEEGSKEDVRSEKVKWGRKMRREGEKEGAVLWYDDAEEVSNGCG